MFEVFRDDASSKRLSIDEAFLDVRGLERLAGPAPAIAARSRRQVRDQVGLDHGRCRGTSSPRSARRRQAGRPPRRARGRRADLPPPAPRRAAVGRRPGDGGQAPRARDTPSARSRGWTRRCSSTSSAGRPAGISTRSPTAATRASCGQAGGAARSAPARARRVAQIARRDRHDRRRARRPRRPPAAKGERVCRTVVLRLRFADFTRATRSHTLSRATAKDQHDPRRRSRAPRRVDPDDRGAGPHARRDRARTSRTSASSSSRSRSIGSTQSTPRSTTCAVRSGRPPSRAPCSSAAIPASSCPCSRTE